MQVKSNLLIVGCGDVAHRTLPLLLDRYRVFGLVRTKAEAGDWRRLGGKPIIGDLDSRHDLYRLGEVAAASSAVLHLAPPPDRDDKDSRTRALVACLTRGGRKSLAQRLVYISTSGVYGDCRGAWVDETRPPAPQTSRARRRLDAETVLLRYGRATAVDVIILRVPGIYAADRLPLQRIREQLPVLESQCDVYTNHIHADDLARAIVAALNRGRPGRIYNVCDNTELKMADYFDRVADAFALARPPRMTRSQIETRLDARQLSFLRESRRLCNDRLKRELRFSLRYPTVTEGIEAAVRTLQRRR